jgi:Heterokaryon incompatibility protein (HET)
MAPQEVLDEFQRFIYNDTPLRTIFIPNMKLVDRTTLLTHFQPSIEEITENDIISAIISPRVDRASAIKQLVQSKVRYAILSHRWLPTGEPSFKEMSDAIASGPGYQKLCEFCRVARGHGLLFAWSDTCCIDKSSSAEFEEAIRSMFRWYRNAAICIAYLVQTRDVDDLQNDEWFRRGWTLQELLAPRVIKFHNADWKPLTKAGNDVDELSPILKLLSRATGITKLELLGFEPGPHKVDRRMTWAAGRRTTKGEDVAYCLMGIFDVGIQISYGEGSDRAFSRLVEAIMQANGNTSVLNWAGKPAMSHSSNALPSSPMCYTGHPHFNSVRKLELAMTSRGLRIPLIVIPVELVGFSELESNRDAVQAKFHCTRYEIGEIVVDMLKTAVASTSNKEWAVGVFNYIPPYGSQAMGLPAIRDWSMAYLLKRRKAQVIVDAEKLRASASEGLKVTVHDDLRYYGWSKVSTLSFVGFSVDMTTRKEAMVVDVNLVETLYL